MLRYFKQWMFNHSLLCRYNTIKAKYEDLLYKTSTDLYKAIIDGSINDEETIKILRKKHNKDLRKIRELKNNSKSK